VVVERQQVELCCFLVSPNAEALPIQEELEGEYERLSPVDDFKQGTRRVFRYMTPLKETGSDDFCS